MTGAAGAGLFSNPWLALAGIALPTAIGYLAGKDRESELRKLMEEQQQKQIQRALDANIAGVNRAYSQAQVQTNKNLGVAGLTGTGIANNVISGLAGKRSAAIGDAVLNARRATPMIDYSQILGEDPSGIWGQLAGYALGGAVQGMFK